MQPSDHPVPTHGIALDGDGDALPRAAGGTVLGTKLLDLIDRARGAWSTSSGVHEEPIRAELFSIERLEQHAAKSLAAAQRTTSKPATDRRLERRLRDNDRALRSAYHATVLAARERDAITPAADWLVDNFHVVEEQVREIRTDFPPGFHRQLPKLIDGPLAGQPRVLGLAWAFVAHTDSQFDPQMLCRFVRAYQHVQPLTIGELWAVAITLRIVLVENLRRLAEDIVDYQAARKAANALADRLLGAGSREAEPADAVLRPFTEPLPTAFAAQLIQRLREQDPRVMPALLWLDERLAAQGTTADAIVHEEHQRQGAGNVTIRNIITSMRLMSSIDWRELFESVSLVDAMLRAESEFAALDFPTRDLYRRAIEELARGSAHPEIEVTRLALLAARRAGDAAGTQGRHARGASARSRLLPDRERTAGIREGDRISCHDTGLAGSRHHDGWNFGLCGGRRDHHRPHRRTDIELGRGARWSWVLGVLALLALIPAIGCGHRLGELRRHQPISRDQLARPRASTTVCRRTCAR